MERITQSFQVSDTVTANRIVYLDSNGKVAHAISDGTAGTYIPIGIALEDQDTTNASVDVVLFGPAKLYFQDTVTSGAVIGSATLGGGVPVATDNTGVTWAIARLLGANVTATGTVAYVWVTGPMPFKTI